MTAFLIVATIICVVELIVVGIMAICQIFPKKKEEDKPTNKTPVKIELQIQYDGYLFTLYSDYTWEVDTLY